MTPRARAVIRLLAVQASYTYERMSGIGVGFAAQPLLAEVLAERSDSERVAALARSADFFNSHPYLAGVAVGATVRAEREHLPAAVISRLRTALSGPLGSLGDQLVWAGEVPALMGFGLVAVWWYGLWAVLAVIVVHNILRIALTTWGLDIGLREGVAIGAALDRSWLPRAAEIAQRAAGLAVGLALPVTGALLLSGMWSREWIAGTAVVALAGALLSVAAATRARASGLRFGLALLGGTAIVVGVFR